MENHTDINLEIYTVMIGIENKLKRSMKNEFKFQRDKRSF